MKPGTMRWLLPLLIVGPLAAQEYYPRHNFTFGAGAALPRGDLKGPFEDAPEISIGYGYRFLRYFQADTGLDIIFGAAGVRDFLGTPIGYFRISDREYFLPFGGRAIAPLFGGRFLLAAGAGGAWLKYHERIRQPSSTFHVDCPGCTSRSGWGHYALLNASYFLDSNKHFRVGATARDVRGHTDGGPLGVLPARETRDRWRTVQGEIGFSF